MNALLNFANNVLHNCCTKSLLVGRHADSTMRFRDLTKERTKFLEAGTSTVGSWGLEVLQGECAMINTDSTAPMVLGTAEVLILYLPYRGDTRHGEFNLYCWAPHSDFQAGRSHFWLMRIRFAQAL